MPDYFSHDHGARNDPKLVKVVMKLGQAGKGIYWDLIEMLNEQGGYLPMSEIETFAFDMRTEPHIIQSLIEDFDLFLFDDKGQFYSESVLRRLEIRKSRSLKASNSANSRWERLDANAMRTQCERNAIKGKERKRKESKEIKNPTLEDVRAYFREKGYKDEAAKNAHEYYQLNGWVDSNGKPVKNWKMKMIGVWFKDENKIPAAQVKKVVI